MLLKALLKIVFKWLFSLFSAVENNLEPNRNGNFKQNGRRSYDMRDERAEVAAEKTLHTLKKAVTDFETKLSRKAGLVDEYAEGSACATGVEDETDINELHAELAELKADIRSLRRMLAAQNGESGHGHHPGDE